MVPTAHSSVPFIGKIVLQLLSKILWNRLRASRELDIVRYPAIMTHVSNILQKLITLLTSSLREFPSPYLPWYWIWANVVPNHQNSSERYVFHTKCNDISCSSTEKENVTFLFILLLNLPKPQNSSSVLSPINVNVEYFLHWTTSFLVIPEELCVQKYCINFSRIFKLSFFIADYRSLRQVLLYKHAQLHLPELQDSHEHKKWRGPNCYGGRWNNGHTQQLGLDRDRHYHGQILHGLSMIVAVLMAIGMASHS